MAAEDEATRLHLSAFVAYQNDNIVNAQENWEASLQELRNRDLSNDGDGQLYAKVLNNLGRCYFQTKQFTKAEEFILKSAEICEKLDMPLTHLMAIINLAECLEKKARENQTLPDMPRLHGIRFLATEIASIVGDNEREFFAWLNLAKQVSDHAHMEGYQRPLLLYDTFECAKNLAQTEKLYARYLYEWAIHHLRAEIALKVKSEELKSEDLFREYVDFCNSNEIEVYSFCKELGFTNATSDWNYPPKVPEFEYL